VTLPNHGSYAILYKFVLLTHYTPTGTSRLVPNPVRSELNLRSTPGSASGGGANPPGNGPGTHPYSHGGEPKPGATLPRKVTWANRVRPGRPVVFFHIGGHKTGTSSLQHVLRSNRAELRRDGMLYPGRDWASHIWANLDLRETGYLGYRAPQVEGAWTRLVREIRRWHGPAIISQEMFSLAETAHIRRALRDLDFADVHIVFTARDMARQLPSVWQEWVKNRSTATFAEFLAAVREPTDEARRFMNLQDVPAILERWSNEVTADRVHLITVPPPGSPPTLLWERFAGVLRLEPDRYNLDILDINPSLGAADAALLRRINAALADELSRPDYDRLVKFGLAPAMATRPDVRIELPDEAFKWAVQWAGRAVEKLAAAGYQLVGDLDDLIPTIAPAGENPDHVGAEAEANAAIAAITRLLVDQATPRSDGSRDRHGKAQRRAAPHRLRLRFSYLAHHRPRATADRPQATAERPGTRAEQTPSNGDHGASTAAAVEASDAPPPEPG
jgi:hypothetical protein